MSLKPVGRLLARGKNQPGRWPELGLPGKGVGCAGREAKVYMPEVESRARNTGSSVVRAPLRQRRPRRCQAGTPRMSQVWCLLDMRNACQVKTAFRGGRVFGE